MADGNAPKRWWETLPGALTAITGVITAITGLIVGLHQVGLLGSKPSTPGAQVSTPSSPSSPTVGNDGATMVLVPAGEFIMGSDADEIDRLLRGQSLIKRVALEDEIPRHRVYLDAFHIDKYEVTNLLFQKFVQATGYRTQIEREGGGMVFIGQTLEKVNGATWRTPQGPGSNITGLEKHPVVQISWQDAKAYCAWAGKRLPTEAEWEKAARGTEGRIWPWGNQFDGTRVNFCDHHCDLERKDNTVNDGYRYTAPVGSYEAGESPYGGYDMAGNVWEWVADWYETTYYQRSPAQNPQGPASGERVVIRGGSWNHVALYMRAPKRGAQYPAYSTVGVGLRCAKSL
jgi:formylglycine-generating enzyme required for sulfatase activity